MKFRGRDKKSSLFWAGIGVIVVITAYRWYGLGTLTSPGPGLLPFLGGLVLVLLSVIIYLHALRPDAKEEREFVQIGNRKILLLIFCLILYAFFFKKVGFALANFLLLTLLFQLLERKSWIVSGLVAAAIIFVSYLVFVVWLEVQLPRGFIGL
jgi:putative tricarboxylic transport membrane protein